MPILAKEFVVDRRQLATLRWLGADAVLLLTVLHRARELRALVDEALDLGLEPLVEVHGERELERALSTKARLIGINNRDLRSLDVDPLRAESLRALVPDDRFVVAESGISEASTIVRYRALGFDAALVGEALMRSADPRAAAASFVAAGQMPVDIAAADRTPSVKICGIVDEDGVLAAARAGADYIGLNLVAGTPRALELSRAAELARFARSLPSAPQVVLVTADLPPAELASALAAVDPDVVQLSGNEELSVPPRGRGRRSAQPTTRWKRRSAGLPQAASAILLDAPHPTMLGGTGQSADRDIAAAVAREVPVILAGGLRPSNVAQSVLGVPAVGVDVASGVEIAGTKPPRKDPLAVALFVKRAKSARFDRPISPARPQFGAFRPAERGRPRSLGEEGRLRWPLRAGNADVSAARAPGHLLRASRRSDLLGRAARAEHALRRPADAHLSG